MKNLEDATLFLSNIFFYERYKPNIMAKKLLCFISY